MNTRRAFFRKLFGAAVVAAVTPQVALQVTPQVRRFKPKLTCRDYSARIAAVFDGMPPYDPEELRRMSWTRPITPGKWPERVSTI